MKTFCLAHIISGTIFSPYSKKLLVKNISKPWPKEVKRVVIVLRTAKVPLTYKNNFFVFSVFSCSIAVFSADRQCLDASTVIGLNSVGKIMDNES